MGDNLAAVDLGSGRTATAITSGHSHNCALLDDGTVKCWGQNAYGQLGQGNTATIGNQANQMGDNLSPIDLGTGRTATAITAGNFHTCAILDNATMKCWGRNNHGQLGQGSTTNLGSASGQMGDDLPPIDLGTGRTATAITAGLFHTCAILDNATMKCWGRSQYGQLVQGSNRTIGDQPGEMGDNLSPINLGTGLTALSTAASGSNQTCVVAE
jgi:alpha-tubulin suppressor-like RCC1 family protein